MTASSHAASGACDACLTRTWLIARLAGHLELHRDVIDELLQLSDDDLIAGLAGAKRSEIERERAAFDPETARGRAAAARLEQICRCREAYPELLGDLAAPPAVLHVAGGAGRLLELVREPTLAIVGARRPSQYGLDVAHSLARGVASAGVTVISGMAHGIDAAAHRGALEVQRATIAVLAGAAELPYPARARSLHARIRASGAVVSEFPPGTRARRWMFPARNRLIAALAALTVVVEARPGSGALLTAGHATEIGRQLGAVPGRITSPLARGPHRLLRDGAQLIEGPEDVLDALFGQGTWRPVERARTALAPELETLLAALADGNGTATALARAGLGPEAGLAALAALELSGQIRRDAGGRYAVRA